MLKQNKSKAQASIEYVVIVTFVLIISVFFVVLLFKTTDVNYVIHNTKQKTLRLISESDSSVALQNIDYLVNENTIDLNLNFLVIHSGYEVFSDLNYTDVESRILDKTKFTEVNFNFNYN